MFRFITEILVRSKVKRENLTRKKAFLPWHQVEKIALLIEQDDSLVKSELDKFIADTQKYVEVFYIELKSKQPSYSDWQCYVRKDKSLFGLPKKGNDLAIKNKRFDLVINTCNVANLFAISLNSSLNAPFRCSSDISYNEADFIVKRLSNQKLLNYLNNILIYLKMVKN